MSNKANDYPTAMLCPLVNRVIDDFVCIENQSYADGEIKEATLPIEFKQKANWRKTCLNCKYFDT